MNRLYKGTRFRIDGEIFMLIESHDKDFIFQIVCIDGYHAGSIEGYVKKQGNMPEEFMAVDIDHLKIEIERNFGVVESEIIHDDK